VGNRGWYNTIQHKGNAEYFEFVADGFFGRLKLHDSNYERWVGAQDHEGAFGILSDNPYQETRIAKDGRLTLYIKEERVLVSVNWERNIKIGHAKESGCFRASMFFEPI